MDILDDASRGGRDFSESMNVGHNIVSALLFFYGRNLKLFGV